MAGAAGLTLGAQTQDIRWALFMSITLYLTCFMCNSIPQSVGYSTDAEMLGVLSPLSEENAGRLYVYRAIGIAALFFMPIPSAPAQLPWQATLPLGLLLLINQSGQYNWLDGICYTVIQALALGLCCWISTELGWVINPVIGVICALAIPKLLLPTTRVRTKATDNNQLFYFPWVAAVFGLLAVWMTPGYSVSAVCNTFFRRGATRSVMQGFLEGAVEGYAMSLMARGVVTGKSTFGDLLTTNILNWSSTTYDRSVMVIAMISILIALVIPIVFVQFSKPTSSNSSKRYKVLTTIFLVSQGVIDTNYMIIVFLAVGYGLYMLRERLGIDEEVSSLGLLSMMM